MHNPNRNSGFTLVELLVTIGIISLLIAIAIPAVQMAREAARRSSCKNNARQIALALHSYEGSRHRLPGPIGLTLQTSFLHWQAETLPYIEQASLKQSIDQKLLREISVLDMIPERTTNIPTFQCPVNPELGTVIRSRGTGHLFAYTDYCGVAGVTIRDGNGVFCWDLKPGASGGMRGIALSEITDGLSNTLMFGERPPHEVGFGCGSWLGAQGMRHACTIGVYETKSSLMGTEDLDRDAPDEFGYGPDERGGKYAWTHHWSFHPAGANFARADASVHFVPYSIDREVLSALATRNGSESVE